MVVVLVGQKNGIDAVKSQASGLVVEVWAAINKDALSRLRNHKSRGAQTAVTSVRTAAHRATTAHFGNARTGARTEKNYLH